MLFQGMFSTPGYASLGQRNPSRRGPRRATACLQASASKQSEYTGRISFGCDFGCPNVEHVMAMTLQEENSHEV